MVSDQAVNDGEAPDPGRQNVRYYWVSWRL